MFRRTIIALAFALCAQGAILKETRLGLKAPEGFSVTLVASEASAGEIAALALDSNGQIVVAGGGTVRRLIDVDGDGKADQIQRIASWTNDVAALCFDNADFVLLDGVRLWRFSDADTNGVADGPPANWGEFPADESMRGLRRGPEGAWYILGRSLRRISHDGSRRDIIAEGFRNPSDLTFNSAGDLFTFDGDLAADFFLPWYVPGRLYHIAMAEQHGTVGPWSKPDYYADAVDILAPIGRADPRGMACYRHTQFPEEYRDNVFFCDAALGRVYVCKLQRFGSTYRPRVDPFLEGIVPEQVEVARDGSLIVGSRHAIYRVEFPAGAGAGRGAAQRTPMEQALQAPQPLDAWSRAKWYPIAQQLGAEAFRRAMADAAQPEALRVRAIEIHVELFGALPNPLIETLLQAKSALVRARAAWALGFQTGEKANTALLRLAIDTDAMTRCAALESIALGQTNFSGGALLHALRQNLEHPDKRIRQLAARIASQLPEASWISLWEPDEAHSVQRELSLLLAASWRAPRPDAEETIWRTLEVLPLARERWQRPQALRLAQIAFGDWNYTAKDAPYELPRPVEGEARTNALAALRAIFPSGDPVSDLETARLLGMLQDDSPEAVEKTARFFEGLVSPTAEFHYLEVLAHLRAPWPDPILASVADTLAGIDARLRGPEQKQHWIGRLKDLTDALIAKEPRLAEKLKPPQKTPPEAK